MEEIKGVALLKDKEGNGSWFLRTEWIAKAAERERLNDIILKYRVEILETQGFTVFHGLGKKQ